MSFSEILNFNIKTHLKRIVPVKVYTLVGRSGTGKSFRAQIIAAKYHIPIIVDDGLIIRKSRIIAGKSAKQEESFASAIQRALFRDEDHLNDALKALSEEIFFKILIIGTSDKMVQRIASTLLLPEPKVTIRIEDIATKEEIDTAMRIRYTQGKHVIPVSPLQIARSYPSIIYDSIRVAMRKKIPFFIMEQNTKENTLVCPHFSRHSDDGPISKAAFIQMVKYCMPEYELPLQVSDVSYDYNEKGYDINIVLRSPSPIPDNVLDEMKEYIVDSLEKYGSILISGATLSVELWGTKQTPSF